MIQILLLLVGVLMIARKTHRCFDTQCFDFGY